MLKNIYLSTIFAALSFASVTASLDQINAIQSNLAHIEQAKTDSMLELERTTTIANQAVEYFQSKLGDTYESDKAHVLSLLNTIVQSDEFTATLNDVTDFYVNLIVNQHMNFNDIIVDSTNYPIEGKIDAVLTQASPALNESTAQMFNLFYVTIAIIRSTTLFCAKLALKKAELRAELAALEAIN